MAVFGILAVTVGRSGWSFTQAFPLGYLFVYFVVSLIFGALLEGRRPSGFQALAAVIMMIGLIINFAGNLRSADSATQSIAMAHHVSTASPEPGE